VRAWGFQTETACDGQDALEKLAISTPNVILTDLKMPRVDGFELLRHINSEGPRIPAIVLTAFGSLETAIETIHNLGAFWFLEKPIQPAALRVLLDRALSLGKLQRKTEVLERTLASNGSLVDMVGSSAVMKQVFSLISQVAPSKAAVLVTGESGTGKELVARAIHALSPRANGPFVAVNCAAMPEALMESELFGHEKGAFTGAVERRAGCFELAEHGTMLLDEIGDMPVATQAKLLRVLEDSKVRRLGARSEVTVDVRIIAATNKSLEEAIKKGEFREDLFYRLNVFQIHLPALRDRMDDVAGIATKLVESLNKKHDCRATDLSSEAMASLMSHRWPGNIRELRNALERAVILAGEGTIKQEHLPISLRPSAAGSIAAKSASSMAVGANALLLEVGMTVEEGERLLILRTLEHTKNNKTRAAEILGISLKTLFNKLKEYGAAEEA
jgi:DNA-binding NtrC family response regulator